VLFAFVDESYSEDYYYVGAFVIDEAQLNNLRDAVKRTKDFAAGFGVPPETELHAHSMMSGTDGWDVLQGKHRASISVYRFGLRQLAALRAKVIVRGVNVAGLRQRYRVARPPHAVALSHTLEDVNAYAGALGERVVVIADNLPDQVDHARRVERYQLVGTGGYRSSLLEHIESPIVFGSSAESPGLQAADLLVYLYRRKDSHIESRALVTKTVEELWAITSPLKPRTWRWNP
jgi:hypothetical protein